MAENQWKKPKDIEGNLQWKNRLSWRDVYFKVSASTIYLYPQNRKVSNQILKKISFTQIEEISDIETKFSRRNFKIILKTGIAEQFKCLNVESLEVQQWIDNLRHALKFWTDKESLKQRKECQRVVTLEESKESSKCLNKKEHRVFFTLWNGEMIGLLVNAASTFTDVYPRLFSFTCEPGSCSVCKIRHQSCDLWAVDTAGTVRLVKKDEILADLEKAGNGLFVMEHHQKLLVVHFRDFSYECLPAPVSITATQVLKLDQIASKLNELGCFDPGLFLREESGNELQFCMNDNPFKFHERGKIVARSKRIKKNSVKKSDYEKITELRWKEYRRFYVNQKTSDVLRKSHADQIQKSCNMDEELCFVDDHFALNDDEMGRGMQAQYQRMPKDKEEYQLPNPNQYLTRSGGNDSDNDGHFRANDATCTPPDSACSGSNILRQVSLDCDWISVYKDDGTSSNDGACAERNNHVTNSVNNKFNASIPRHSSSNDSFAGSNQDISNKASSGKTSTEQSNDVKVVEEVISNAKVTSNASHYSLDESNHGLSNKTLQDGTRTNHNDDETNLTESNANARTASESSHCSLGENNQDFSNRASPDGTSTKNTNDDVTNLGESTVGTKTTSESSHSLAESKQDLSNKAFPNDTSANHISDVTNCVESTSDATKPTALSWSYSLGTGNQDVSNMVSPDDGNRPDNNNNDVANLTESTIDSTAPRDSSSNYSLANSDQDVSRDSSNDATNMAENSTDASKTSGSSHHSLYKCDRDVSNKPSPDGIGTNHGNDVPNLVESNIDAGIPSDGNYNSKVDQDQAPGPNTSSSPSKKSLIHSHSVGSVFRKERPGDQEKLSHASGNRIGMRRSLSDLNIHYSFTNASTRDARSMSESDLLESNLNALVADVYTPKNNSDDSDEDVFIRPKVSTLTGPTWTFAKRVEECVQKILVVRENISEMERLIADELCEVLFELLNHGLKKSFLGISVFASATNVWSICQIVCKETSVAAAEIERIKQGRIREKFHTFIRECIRKEILSRWFEVLSTEKVQKRIMKHYESNAVVLEPEHSKAMEHLKIHLDGLNILKLKALKARQFPQDRPTLLMLE